VSGCPPVEVKRIGVNVTSLLLATSKEGARSGFLRLADVRHILKKNTFIENQILPRDYETNQNRPVFKDFITMPPHAENNPWQDTTVRIPRMLFDSFHNPTLHTDAQRRAYILYSSFVRFIPLAVYIRLNK
jgi:hypothetical protein